MEFSKAVELVVNLGARTQQTLKYRGTIEQLNIALSFEAKRHMFPCLHSEFDEYHLEIKN